jgi:predicted ribosome quality control (RQC) complex YloA/Tae2 family protein
MLSYLELRRAAGIFEPMLSGTIVQRIVQVDNFSLTLAFRGGDKDRIVFFSCRPDFARLSLAPEMPRAPAAPPTFVQYAKAHLSRAAFDSIGVAAANRQVHLRLRTPAGRFELILSILGARSNVYILDPEGRVAHALRPLEETRRELVLGGAWCDPEGGLPSGGIDRWESISDDALLPEIEKSYQRLERARELANLSRKLEHALSKEIAFLARKAANLREDLGEARAAAGYKRRGELLKGALHTIKHGDEAVRTVDFDTGETLMIPLDPALSPAGNLEAYFGRYQKELRSVAAIEEQIDSVRKAQLVIEELQTVLQVMLAHPEPSLDALVAFGDHPRMRRLLVRYYPSRKPPSTPMKKPAGKKELPGRLLPKRYRTANGLEIWVGRNDEGNDYLTTRLARGNDLFFHLEGYPGSHVVLRTEGRTDPPPESILAACELAVHFSRLKDAGRADVHVAHIKDVKKPKGVKRGLVYVTRGKTIHLRRDPKRLEDILASRLNE